MEVVYRWSKGTGMVRLGREVAYKMEKGVGVVVWLESGGLEVELMRRCLFWWTGLVGGVLGSRCCRGEMR